MCCKVILSHSFFFLLLILLVPTNIVEAATYDDGTDDFKHSFMCISKNPADGDGEGQVKCKDYVEHDGPPLVCYTQICEEKSTGAMKVWKGCNVSYTRNYEHCPRIGCHSSGPESDYMEIKCEKCRSDWCNKPELDITSLGKPTPPMRCYEYETITDEINGMLVPIPELLKEITCWPGQFCYSQLCKTKKNRSIIYEFKGCAWSDQGDRIKRPTSGSDCGLDTGCIHHGYSPDYAARKCLPCSNVDFCNREQLLLATSTSSSSASNSKSTSTPTSSMTSAITEQKTSINKYSISMYNNHIEMTALLMLITFALLTFSLAISFD